jgi:hypothetical protein
MRKGAIWNVYVSTSPRSGGANVTELEFEDTGANPARYRRPVDGPLLEALHNGAPVSRSSLQDELELALADTTAPDGASDDTSIRSA